MRIKSRQGRAIGALLTAGLVTVLTAGCLQQSGDNGGSSASGGADDGTVTIMYGFTDSSSDQFKAEIKKFTDAEGINVKFEPTPDFNTVISTRVSGNSAPDIAIFPQPGIMKSFKDQLTPLTDIVDKSNLDKMVPGIVQAGQIDGQQYALPMSLNIKSIVFYPKGPFEQAGYTAPATLADLETLTNTIKASGTAPWCFGIESASATGWPATDWIENLLLIQSGPEVYNQWVSHEIPFNDPKVVAAADTMNKLLLTEGNVNGGRQSIASNNFATAANPMFNTPPACYMYRQGNFVARDGGFPDTVLSNLDSTVGVFPMPGQTAADKPVLGGGDLASVFNNTENVKKVMNYMASADFGKDWAKANGFISPRTDFDKSNYPNELTKQMAGFAYDSTSFVFDGSDQMPGEVGSGSFWREMTAWISGSEDEKTALDNIQASWPAS
ncbi:alpha-glucoside transport system substrate-binding protein [Quadrisphaera granulorum]|uniref:Alpha-glucoside transport system substrate-binding protein n=1 Tax=Quadrisphaera granulorum TaxID=317664 RepID=A0A316A9T3_9ACTN|nr:ABC transporter substrate-binding protein [Quadrisphaera granulorum]PWJ54676.1 alpha-glucoside transport system substrate-binding protein [Quadrisphaera granulorum]SZE96038.1 alpha-glucoside transport system substrate-binding protein [Quadrisphaera granulorum]